ncbi:hypothetical protein COL5a_000627 [Colletotrichum fioriniae]|nr:hypothetical protein COL5a_000627 [Colletotrichum fioriniae]
MSSPTVGSLLAAIATLVSDGLRILKFADKRQWGPDEHEQLRLLEDTLDDAKKDFQELSVLVNGQRYYMNDRKPEESSTRPVPPISPTTGMPNWQATGFTADKRREEKTVIFAPLAIANHMAPYQGDWVARLLCPFCDEAPYTEAGGDSDDEMRNTQDESGFEDLQAFQEHLEWQHTAASIPAVPLPKAAKDCVVM